MRGLKEVLRSQDQELKQLRVQVSLGGSVKKARVCEEKKESVDVSYQLEEKEKEIQALQMQVDDAMLQKKELEKQVEEDKTRVAALEEALAEKEKESVVVPSGSDGVTEEKERWSRGERESEV